MKYKVGDKVRIRSNLKETDDYRVYGIGTNREMVGMAGKVVTISHVDSHSYRIKECGFLLWTDEMFECIEKPSREDLLKMPVGTKIITDKGKELVYDGECFSDKDDVIMDTMIDDDLNLIYDDMDYGTKIIEILEPEYRTIWKEEVKKMTLKEIEKELGYPVEIVEEEKEEK